MAKEPNDKELDKMIDRSVKDMKTAEKKEEPLQPKQEKAKDTGVASQKSAKQAKDEMPKADAKKESKPEPAAPVIKVTEEYDPWKILMYPHLAEKSMNMVELENKLVFVVRRNAKRDAIKEAVEKGFNVKVLSVNVTITRKGHKKAFIKLASDYNAADIATRLGMI